MKNFFSKIKQYVLRVYIATTICIIGGSIPFASKLLNYWTIQRSSELREEANLKLKKHVYAVMNGAGFNVAPQRKEILADDVVRIANKVLKTQEEKEYFATLIALESRYNKEAKSPVGAIGLAQIMPKYAKDFSTMCQLGDLYESDLLDSEINLMLGACLFRDLLKATGGNVAAALVGYNAGRSSQSFRQLSMGVNIDNPEAANYPSKAFFIQQKAKNVEKQEKFKNYVVLQENGEKKQ